MTKKKKKKPAENQQQACEEQECHCSCQGKCEEEAGHQEEAPPCDVRMRSIPEIEYERLSNEVKDYKDKYMRLLAETENSHKRLQKEKQGLMKFAIQDLVTDILRPLDQFENALAFADQAPEEVRNWAIGFQMILSQFKDVFVNHGVTSYSANVGDHFDPHFHEAVEMVETEEYQPGTIMKEFVKGYKMGDRTIRPAHVQVAKAPEKKEPECEEKSPETEENTDTPDEKVT